jgi:hypothetical protein
MTGSPGRWWAISSDANGLYVTAQFGYAGASFGELTASSSSIGPDQKWLLSCVPGAPGGPPIDFVVIQAQTNLNYVSTELGYTGANYAMLRARAATADLGKSTTTSICAGNGNRIPAAGHGLAPCPAAPSRRYP